MIRGFFASRSGLAWEQSRSDVIANNVANVNTSGFKRGVAVGAEFGQVLLKRLGDQLGAVTQAPQVGVLGSGATLDRIAVDNTPGAVEVTAQSLDVALEGPGEFMFLGPAGPGYTRAGSFHRDASGMLVTADGFPLLVGGAPVGAGAGTLQIIEGGTVIVDGKNAGTLDIRGGSAARIRTGGLERSNVDLAQEMTDLITALRSFQANQRALQMQDQTLEKTVTEIGRV